MQPLLLTLQQTINLYFALVAQDVHFATADVKCYRQKNTQKYWSYEYVCEYVSYVHPHIRPEVGVFRTFPKRLR